MAKKIVIIGGVAGGATTAARLRRKDETAEIVVLERGEYISYANCGLPYYIGDVIQNREALLLQTPENMKQKFNIDVRVRHEAVEIKPEEKIVRVKNLADGNVYEEKYDKLVLATGSSPIKPPIEGIDSEHIFTLWTVPDTDKIKTYIQKKKPKKAAVIGGGFIGLEMAENLAKAGLEVSIIEMQNQVMAPLDGEMANLLHENIRMNGVQLILGDGVKAFGKEQGKNIIELNSGNKLETDLVLLSIGVKPNSQLAKAAGLDLNEKGGVKVDEHLQTSRADIYAVGDVIEVNQLVTGEKGMIPLAGPANKQARILADILTGEEKEYQGSLGTAVAQVFDLQAASVGINEKQLKQQGKIKNRDYYTVLINQKSHAGYYPQAVPITLKLIFDGNKKIFGAQIVGQDGVDKRIDTIASVMRLGGSTEDLTKLELAYAPPFSSAKDPVNMLGFVAENLLQGMVSFVEWDELDRMREEQPEQITILDVTEEIERSVFRIEGSYHIPLGLLRERMEELNRETHIIVYCAIGVRAYNGARILIQNGFSKVSVLSGGLSFYKSMHHQNLGGEVMTKREAPKEGLDFAEERELQLLDCSGLQCPGPIMKVNEAMGKMKDREVLKVSATDMGFSKDIVSWCKSTGNTFLKAEKQEKQNIVYIQKGREKEENLQASSITPEGKTLIVFSGDLDKVLASFIIANGAAAMGKPVTMFFTFWGLNALRKSDVVNKKKPFMDKMFGKMMPKGSKKLKLSKMNMAGMGTAMMKKVMNDKNVDSLEDLMKKAMKNGVRLVACTMSMDIMGITREELLDGVELAGVASYLGDAEESNVNLFI